MNFTELDAQLQAMLTGTIIDAGGIPDSVTVDEAATGIEQLVCANIPALQEQLEKTGREPRELKIKTLMAALGVQEAECRPLTAWPYADPVVYAMMVRIAGLKSCEKYCQDAKTLLHAHGIAVDPTDLNLEEPIQKLISQIKELKP